MFTVVVSPKAQRDIKKLGKKDKQTKDAIKDYLENDVQNAKDKKALYDIGGTELVGNLKGLWRFKRKEFKGYRILAHIEDERIIITIIAVEGRNESYDNKEAIAKKARNGKLG